MRIIDKGDPNAGGFYILQHSGYAGKGWSVDLRGSIGAVRVIDRDDQTGGEGHWKIDTNSPSDINGGQFWITKNPIIRPSMARFATPVIAQKPEGAGTVTPSTAAGACAVLPDGGKITFGAVLDGGWGPDTRLQNLEAKRPRNWGKMPLGTIGISLVADNENEQENLFFPTNAPLVAVNRLGDMDMGSRVFDMGPGFVVDPDRFGRLQSMIWVVKKGPGSSVLAWNLGPSGCEDTDGGYGIDKPFSGSATKEDRVVGEFSAHKQGPLCVGGMTDRHRHGADADGHPINAGHLHLRSFFWFTDAIDGPLHFDGAYEQSTSGPIKMVTHFEWDGAEYRWHSFCQGYTPTDEVPPGKPGDPPPKEPPGEPTGGIPGGGDNGGIPGGIPFTSGGGDQGPLPGFPQGPGNPFDQPNPFGDGGTVGSPGGVPGPFTPDNPSGGFGDAPGGGGTTGSTGGGQGPTPPPSAPPSTDAKSGELINELAKLLQDPNLSEADREYITAIIQDYFANGGSAENLGTILDYYRNKLKSAIVPIVRPFVQGNDQLRYTAFPRECAMPTLMGRPQHFQASTVDFRNWGEPQWFQRHSMDVATPIIGRIEAFGQQVVGGWTYTERPRNGRYLGGTGDGGWCIMPPEIGLEDAGTTFAPAGRSLSTVYFGALTGNYFAAGLPDTTTGGFKTGFRWGKSGNYLNFDAMDTAGALAAQIFRLSTSTDYQAEVQLGLGGLYGSLIGSISESFTTAATGANTLETNLKTLSVTANSLNNVGKGFTFRAGGTFAANSNVKTVRAYYAGTLIAYNDGVTNPNGLDWEIEGEVSQISATVAYATVRMNVGGVKQSAQNTSVAADYTAANTLAVTGQNGVPAASDITENYLTVKGIT